MKKFHDRRAAGKQLASRLAEYAGHADVIVLGIPRGGVVVADEIARALRVPLDVMITRKLGAPGNPELAVGAVAGDGTVLVDRQMIADLHISERELEQERARQLGEIERRTEMYRGDKPPLNLVNKTVILIDDGIATGATVIAALRALRVKRPRRVVLAVPVAPGAVVPQLRAECSQLVLLASPEPFIAVGNFYENFAQVTDDEVLEILHR